MDVKRYSLFTIPILSKTKCSLLIFKILWHSQDVRSLQLSQESVFFKSF